MGASSWYYFAPYQEDVSQVLQELRQRVFEQGGYWSMWTFLKSIIETGRESYCQWVSIGHDSEVVEEQFNRLEMEWERVSKTPPQTINEVLALNDSDGTNSLLDIEKVSSSPGFRTIAPFEGKALLALFGTETPTREQIETVLEGEKLWKMLPGRWSGLYCVVYQEKTPHEIFFAGITGD